MTIYRDPEHEAPIVARLRALAERIRRAIEASAPGARADLGSLRVLLVLAGQLEQAIEDLGAAPPALRRGARVLTDYLARAFADDHAPPTPASELGLEPRGRVELRLAAALAERLAVREDVLGLRGNFRVPEGLAHHALLPDRALVAGEVLDEWLRGQCPNGQRRDEIPSDVSVIGLRSIGTTTSAVVAAELERLGHGVRRTTVRPFGHPFRREVHLDPEFPPGDLAVVVDEGPGLSGSSMVAAARALVRRGVGRRKIVFLPGHREGPGPEATPAIRTWWACTTTFAPTLEEGGFFHALAREVEAVIGAPVTDRDDLGGGLWREHVMPGEAAWPASRGRFERPKWRVFDELGRGHLVKFFGDVWSGPGDSTAVERALVRQRDVARIGFGPEPEGHAMGLLVLPWVDGRPATASDLTGEIFEGMANYLAGREKPLLAGVELDAALDRLVAVLDAHAHLVVGEPGARTTADRARALARGLSKRTLTIPAYVDGRLAPWEWLVTRGRGLVKTDATGHDLDHTWPGPLPVHWDVASAVVEWSLDPGATRELLALLAARGLDLPIPELLTPMIVAYGALRAAELLHLAELPGVDPSEAARLSRDALRLRSSAALAIGEGVDARDLDAMCAPRPA